MRIRPKTRVQLYQVLIITFFWVLCGAFLAVYKCVTYDTVTADFIFVVPQDKTLGSFILTNMIGPFIGGITGGALLSLYLNDRLRRRSYAYFLFVNTLVFLAIIFALNSFVSYFFYYRQEILSSDNMWSALVRYLVLDPYALRNIVTWIIIAWLTLFAVRIYEKYGPETFVGLLKGKFHRAHEVERVFMFLDISDSTAIAENIGHVPFFNLLRDFYADITDPILNSRGEIHQYVGDEVIIAWELEKAVSESPHCIACFFRIEKAIQSRTQYYLKHYGVIPTFKAAIHKGKVVVGEMGVIKREIVYSGDTLNTISRMLEQCKVHDQKLIASQDVLDMIPTSMLEKVRTAPIGEIVLRGKVQRIKLYGITQG